MSGLQLDNKISVGHIISVVIMFVTGITAYADLRATQNQFTKELVTLTAGADNREIRLRAIEILQAGQGSDLRAILNSISRIETAIDKIGAKP